MTTDKNRIIVIALLLITFCVLQSSCSAQVNNQSVNMTATAVAVVIGDGGFFSNKPCGPPCFFDIVPGTTTKDQAISLIQSHGLYLDCQEYDNRRQGGAYGIGCQFIDIGLQNNTDIVSGVGFQPSGSITVSEVIAKYGNPSAVSMAAIDPSNRGEFTAYMTLYYDSIRVSLGLVEQKSGEFNLTPDTLVAGIGYDDQDSYNLGRRYSQKWNGYRVYQETNP